MPAAQARWVLLAPRRCPPSPSNLPTTVPLPFAPQAVAVAALHAQLQSPQPWPFLPDDDFDTSRQSPFGHELPIDAGRGFQLAGTADHRFAPCRDAGLEIAQRLAQFRLERVDT